MLLREFSSDSNIFINEMRAILKELFGLGLDGLEERELNRFQRVPTTKNIQKEPTRVLRIV